jgi:tetratricopeptide (TPR) repeat protein
MLKNAMPPSRTPALLSLKCVQGRGALELTTINMHATKTTTLIILCVSSLNGCSTINSELNIGHKIGEANKAMLNREFDHSEHCYDEALDMIGKEETKQTITHSVADYSKALAFAYKGLLYVKESKPDDAIKNFETAKQLFENQKHLSPPGKKVFAESLKAYASLLKDKNKLDHASELEDEALRLDGAKTRFTAVESKHESKQRNAAPDNRGSEP